jgi:AraC-like DNA-binding protein
VYILHKGSRHFYTTGPEGSLNKYFIGVEGTIADYLIHVLGLFNQIQLKTEDPDYLKQLFDQLVLIARKHGEDSEIETSAIIYQILLELGKSVSQALPGLVRKALCFMQNNLGSSLSRQEICEYVNISPSHFNRLFLKYMKCSPIQYLLQLRLQWSAGILARTSMSIKEIAFLTGFSDPLHFSAQFKKHIGVSPKFYRLFLQSHNQHLYECQRALRDQVDPLALPF